jgi:hypothetical protein
VQHHGGEKYTPGHSGEEEIHLPSPTLAPSIIGLGVTFLSFGILFGIGLIVLGAVVMVLGIAMWLINDAREFEKAGEHGGHGGH